MLYYLLSQYRLVFTFELKPLKAQKLKPVSVDRSLVSNVLYLFTEQVPDWWHQYHLFSTFYYQGNFARPRVSWRSYTPQKEETICTC